METPSSRVLELWREHARDRYEFYPQKWVTGVTLDPEELERVVRDTGNIRVVAWG